MLCPLFAWSHFSEDRETERGKSSQSPMVLAVSHTHALALCPPLHPPPPVSLSPMTTFIMYSEGIIRPSLPLSHTHVHHHPSHHERGMDVVGLRHSGDAHQTTRCYLPRLTRSFDVLFRRKTGGFFRSAYSSPYFATSNRLAASFCVFLCNHGPLAVCGTAAGCTCVAWKLKCCLPLSLPTASHAQTHTHTHTLCLH